MTTITTPAAEKRIHYVPTAYRNVRLGGWRACVRIIRDGKMFGSTAGALCATKELAESEARCAALIASLALSRRPEYRVTVG